MTKDTPGYYVKVNRNGERREYWRAPRADVKAGFSPKYVRLHYPDTPDGRAQLAGHCQRLQAELLSWRSHGGALPRGYDGTVRALAHRYGSDELSPYRRLKWNSQRHIDQCIKVIVSTVGARQIGKLLGPDFERWHSRWGEDDRLWRAKHCMDTFRRMVHYGVTLGYDDCIRAATILSRMRFPTPAARRARMMWDQVIAIRQVAHDMGLGSIALATVLQFELSLRQKDVIGEWEPSEGGIMHKGMCWVNGLTWSDIDANMILTKRHTKTGAHGEYDLKLYPSILEELERVPREQRVGPMITSEATGEPYKHRTFTQTWRRVADKAGVPKAVWNMDARAGAISEAYDAGAVETDVMKHAGHKNRQTSARYNRGSIEATSRVAKLRLSRRNTPKT